MPAPKGNEFWKQRSTHGRNPIFEKPEDLLDACYQYFQWVEENPLYESKAFANADTKTIPKMRAMTIGGLCIYVGIGRTTWDEFKKREGFAGVIAQVEQILYTQKFEGAAADLLNGNIISRDLGLKDQQEVELNASMDVTNRWTVQPVKTAGGKHETPE